MGTESKQPFDIGHWILRLIALIIDSIIIGIIAGIIAFWLGWWSSFLVFPFFLGILEVLYFAFFEVYMDATIGKKVIGLKVQLVGGGKVTLAKAFIRNISKIHGLLLLLDWIIAVVTPGPDQRQKYSDRIAGTTVVQISAPLQSLVSVPEENK
jgi:uncharacterized RDD family membrane protein YckC